MKTNIEQFIFVTYQTGVWVLELCFIYIKWTPKIIIIYLYLGVRWIVNKLDVICEKVLYGGTNSIVLDEPFQHLCASIYG